MNLSLQELLSFAPILMAAIMLVILKWTVRLVMPLVYLAVISIVLFSWGISFTHVMASTIIAR